MVVAQVVVAGHKKPQHTTGYAAVLEPCLALGF